MNDLRIELDDGRVAFGPGDMIRGRVWLGGLGGRGDDGGELRLFWYTEGKGTRDVEVIETIRVDGGEGSAGVAFEFVAPNSPYSFSGRLITLVWALELVSEDEDKSERVEITIGPGRVEVDLSVFPEVEKRRGWRVGTA